MVSFSLRYTELEIVVPEIGIVGLHAENLGIENVYVDGEPAEFEYYPYNCQVMESESRWSYVTTPSTAADAAGSAYISALERELVPNLLINCCKSFKSGGEQQEQLVLENGVQQQSSGETKQVMFAICAFQKLNQWYMGFCIALVMGHEILVDCVLWLSSDLAFAWHFQFSMGLHAYICLDVLACL